MKAEPKYSHTFYGGSTLAEMLNDCSIDGIISIDNNWMITTWNRTTELITGITRSAAFGNHLLRVLPHMQKDEDTLASIHHAFEGYTSFLPPAAAKHRQQLENYFIPLNDPQLGMVGIMNIIHDVAHRMKAEQKLQQLNAEMEKRYRQLQLTSAELANFTVITSNHIKKPIRAVYTMLEQLIKSESDRLSNNGKASFRRIQSSLNKMNLLLDDLQHLAQIGMPDQPGDVIQLEEVMNEVLTGLHNSIEEKAVQLLVHPLCKVRGYKDQLVTLFRQLLNNAIKFNQRNPPTIEIYCEALTPASDSQALQQLYNKVTVKDNGIGMEQSAVDRIFDVFQRLGHEQQYKGSGMGLAIARKIMYAHGGYIEVESEPGMGSLFHCYFPVTDL